MDELQKLTDNMLPFATYLGIEFTGADKASVSAKMLVRPELCTRPEVLHGGAIMAFADTLGASAAILNLREGAWTTTVESKTNFVAPAPVGTLIYGKATAVHIGSKTMIWQTRVSSQEGKLVALVTQTQLVIGK